MVSVQAPVSHDRIIQSLQLASAQTGTDFEYLLETAKRESSLKPQAKAKTSSAAGLFQFIEQTWLGAVKQYGDKAGIGSLSDSIGTNDRGRHIVTDDQTKAEILALRHDVDVSSVIAGMMSKDSQSSLEKALGRDLRDGELYVAHFMGVRGAQKFIEAYQTDPTTKAADLFTAAAKANKRLFYAKDGQKLSVGEVYSNLTQQTGSSPAVPKSVAETTEVTSGHVSMVSSGHASIPNNTESTVISRTMSPSDFFGLRLAGFGERFLPALPAGSKAAAVPGSLVEFTPVLLDVLAAIGEDMTEASSAKAKTPSN